MTLLSFLECVVGSSWIKKGRESVESLDRSVTSVVVWKMRKNCHSVLIKTSDMGTYPLYPVQTYSRG